MIYRAAEDLQAVFDRVYAYEAEVMFYYFEKKNITNLRPKSPVVRIPGGHMNDEKEAIGATELINKFCHIAGEIKQGNREKKHTCGTT